jgi:aspartyl-tRNA(Asn)/glutamyl-tRNA(Gln) amidotransferase subunit A
MMRAIQWGAILSTSRDRQNMNSPPGFLHDAATTFPDIPSLHAMQRRGELSAVDLVQACLRRIERFEPRLRAWVLVDAEGAVRQARGLDEETKRGKMRGPLHGIPIGIKDIIDVAGFPTRAGSPLLADAPPAERDAALVARLRAAGAVILGKTVTTEFAGFDPSPTFNPWNLDRTPGGSSSGSAAAVAAGMCVAAIGSQTGGSITRPASFCGVAGFKPTHGRVSCAGVVPISVHLDHPGPIARRVADLAQILTAIAGPDDDDPWCRGVPADDFARRLDREGAPTLGIIEEFLFSEAHAHVRDVVRNALGRLAGAGAAIAAVRPPPTFAGLHEHHRRIMAVDAAVYHRPNFPARRAAYGPQFQKLLDEGHAAGALDFAASLQHQALFRREMEWTAEKVDALVTPATVTTAPTRETTGDPRFNSPFSYCGLPTVSIPCGLTEDALPVALQLAASPWREAELLSVAAWSERILAFRELPAILK